MPVVGAACRFVDACQAAFGQLVLLFVFGFAVISAAHAQFQFFVESAGSDIEIDGIFWLAALMEAGCAESSVHADRNTVDI